MIKVNLLSPERKEISGGGPEGGVRGEEEREPKLNKGAAIAAAIITLGVIGYLYITQTATLDEAEKLLEERRARKTELDEVLKTIVQLENSSKRLDKKVELINNLKKQQLNSVHMMDELCDALPDWVWLTSLNFNNKKLSLVGKAMTNNLISDFINNLKGTDYFNEIEFPGSQREREAGMDVFNFRLTCTFIEREEKKVDNTNITDNKKKGQ